MAKFLLIMKDGVAVRRMSELREHFDLKEAIKYLGNGRLMKWLRDHGKDKEADKLDTLIDECKDNHRELAERLCSILGVEFDATKIDAKELEGLNELSRKAERLGQYTSDSLIKTNAARAAFDQADLDKLAKDDKPEIYLCNGEFTIPLEAHGKHYYGIGNVVAIIPSDEYVDFEELGITFDKKYKVKFDEKYASIDQAGTIEQQKETCFRLAQDAYASEDYQTAIKYFKQAADWGHITAMTKLGRLYYEEKAGDALEASEAVKWLECAAAEHDTGAMQLLSDIYCNGHGVEKDEEKAFRYAKESVEDTDEPSKESLCLLGHLYRLGAGTDKDSEKAWDYLKKAAEMGVAAAMNELGIMYENGDGIVPQDMSEAKNWFIKAARAGNENAMLNLGRWYEEHEDLYHQKEYGEAAEWYREAMKAGNPEGMFRLGCLYLEGNGVAKEENTAFNLIKQAAETNNVEAMNCLGYLYDEGKGVSVNKEQAMKWYRKAAEAGDTKAMVNIGCCYMNGDGVKQDYVEGAKWFKEAADRGDANGMYKIGWIYIRGDGVETDSQLAFKWFEKAAEAGDSDAMCEMGKWYQEILGDADTAQNWYLKAANAGNALGMERLGDCLKQKGKYGKAKNWYEKAAKLGRGEAAYKIAQFYKKGSGVKKDQELEDYWIEEAAKLGYTSIWDSKAVKAADTVAENIFSGYGLAKKVLSFFN